MKPIVLLNSKCNRGRQESPMTVAWQHSDVLDALSTPRNAASPSVGSNNRLSLSASKFQPKVDACSQEQLIFGPRSYRLTGLLYLKLLTD